MPPVAWKIVDTRRLGNDRDSGFDGFVHILPQAVHRLHEMRMQCWCHPRLLWSPEGGTVIVSHKHKTRRKRSKE